MHEDFGDRRGALLPLRFIGRIVGSKRGRLREARGGSRWTPGFTRWIPAWKRNANNSPKPRNQLFLVRRQGVAKDSEVLRLGDEQLRGEVVDLACVCAATARDWREAGACALCDDSASRRASRSFGSSQRR